MDANLYKQTCVASTRILWMTGNKPPCNVHCMEKPQKKPKTPEGIALGERVRSARNHAGISQEQLAKEVGATQQMIASLEAGWHPSSGLLIKIAHRCKVSAWWLDSGEGSMLDPDIPISPPEQTLLLEYRAIPHEDGKSQVMDNILFWNRRSPGGDAAKGIRRSRKTTPPRPGPAARRGTKGRGSSGG